MTPDRLNTTYAQAVETIKTAILDAQYEAAKGVNNIQLMLYYAIGRFISQNTRKNKWGTGAIATISQMLQHEMPGLRGYSETSLKRMRIFYEAWMELDVYNSSIQTDDLQNSKSFAQTNDLPDTISSIQTDEIQIHPFNFPAIDADRAYVEYMIQDYDKPMGVATYKTATDMPEHLRNSLPDQESLLKLMKA